MLAITTENASTLSSAGDLEHNCVILKSRGEFRLADLSTRKAEHAASK
jgi:hypothetical protein